MTEGRGAGGDCCGSAGLAMTGGRGAGGRIAGEGAAAPPDGSGWAPPGAVNFPLQPVILESHIQWE